jgi:NAD(P)H dehydrogenase (quinone)
MEGQRMKIFVILCHPSKSSFNHAIAEAVVKSLKNNGHDVFFHDLYEERFDPILPFVEIPKDAPVDDNVLLHCNEIAEAEGIIVVHPNWWGQPPAILKGWVDRVIRAGVAYEFIDGDDGDGVPIGLLKAKTAMVFNTSNTPINREINVFGDPLQLLWKNCIFDLCGVEKFYRKMFEVIVNSSLDQRSQWLEEVKETVSKYFKRNDA